jgi:hypothetical protein
VLTLLDQVAGVERSYADPSGTHLRLTLCVGADPERVAQETRRILLQQVEDRTAVRLSRPAALQALRREWQDQFRVAGRAAGGAWTEGGRASSGQAGVGPSTGAGGAPAGEGGTDQEPPPERPWLLALILALMALILAYLVWRGRRANQAVKT